MSRCFANAAILAAALLVNPALAAPEKPVDEKTGLIIDKGFDIVRSWCTSCHSAKLITQAGKTREGWIDSIRWMQKNQGLWDLGQFEDTILDYLSKNYGVPAASTPLRPPVMPLPPR